MSKLIAGIGGMQQGKYNAQAAETEGQGALADGAATEARIRADARMAAGEALAAQGQSGFQIGTGSALDLLRESAITAELDQLTVRTKAENMRRVKFGEARLARAQGRNALLAGIIGTAEDAAMAAAGGAGGAGFAAAKGAGGGSSGGGGGSGRVQTSSQSYTGSKTVR